MGFANQRGWPLGPIGVERDPPIDGAGPLMGKDFSGWSLLKGNLEGQGLFGADQLKVELIELTRLNLGY
jgi:hypothetical protein